MIYLDEGRWRVDSCHLEHFRVRDKGLCYTFLEWHSSSVFKSWKAIHLFSIVLRNGRVLQSMIKKVVACRPIINNIVPSVSPDSVIEVKVDVLSN